MIKRFIVLLFALALIANGTFFWISPEFDASSWTVLLGWGLFFSSLLISVLLTPLVRTLAISLDFVDRPKGRKSHERVTPLGGGIPIFFSVSTMIFGGLIFAYAFDQKKLPTFLLQEFPEQLAIHISGMLSVSSRILVLMTGGTILFLTGLFDDKFGLSAKWKLAIQILVACFVAYFGITISLFREYWYLSYPITILWIVGITNAFNLLDNMDGLSSGVVFICALNLLMVCLNTKQLFIGALLIVLMGANLGFLLYNFPPAKIFMGDGGSLFMGYMLATATVQSSVYQKTYSLYPIIVPLLILSVPIYDTLSVIWIRIRAGYSIFRADNNHFSHRLVALGFSRPNAVIFIYLVTFTTGIAATLLDRLDLRGGILIAIQIFFTLLIIALLESVGKKSIVVKEAKEPTK